MRLKNFDNFGSNYEVKYMWNYTYDFVSTMAYMITSIWKFISFLKSFYNNITMSLPCQCTHICHIIEYRS